jgi:hypothetical protein
VVRIAISQAAFDAIARTLPVRLGARAGEEGKERQPWFAVGFFCA